MYKNLSPKALGITGRQSEIIELALTYGFRGLELDIHDFLKRVEHHGLEHTTRFIRSAQIKIGGFELPVRWRGDEALFRADLAKLEEQAGLASAAGARNCHTLVWPASDTLPYHENFELHRRRLGEIAGVLDKHQIRLGVGLLAAPSHRREKQFQFIHEADALLTLLKTVGHKNLGLMLDTWNWRYGGGTLEMIRSLGATNIVSVHLADGPAGADPAAITEEQRLLPSPDGDVGILGALGLLNELGYRGPVTPMPHPKCFTGMTRDAIVQKCGNILEELWKAIGLSRSGRLFQTAGEHA